MLETINPANLAIAAHEWVALMPGIILVLGAMLALLLGTFDFGAPNNRRKVVFATSILTLAAAVAYQCMHWQRESIQIFGGMLTADYFSSFFTVLICGGTLLVLLGAYQYLEREGIHYSEFYVLVLLATFGMVVLAGATELLTLFIAIETMSLSVYVLVGLRRRDRLSNEASVKYFVMGGVGAAILLYGISFIYGATATTKLPVIAQLLTQNGSAYLGNPIFILGLVLILVGFLFKIAAAPFHMWTPDVYEGAPTVVTQYMSAMVKSAVFASLVRIFVVFWGVNGVEHLGQFQVVFHDVLWVLALLTMLIGNIVALMQKNLKRLLAYSAIAHTGYLMLGLLAGPESGYFGILIYLVSYVAMNIGIFTVLSFFGEKGDASLNIENLSGIGHRHPVLAFALVVFLLSLGGLPPTAGFVGKYFLFSSALEAGETLLVLLAIALSVISVYYYIRIVVQMYMKDEAPAAGGRPLTSPLALAALGICLLLTLKLGILPEQLLEAVKKAAAF